MTKVSFRELRLPMVLGVALAGLSAGLIAQPLGPLTNQQLAAARAGTAAYHDVSVAVADGYVPTGFNPGEGVFEFVNFPKIGCTFDPSHPTGLGYVASPDGLKLVSVEYAIPWACTAPGVPPEGFAGDDDVWLQERDLPVWRLSVRIWAGGPEGPFEDSGGGETGTR